MGMNYEDAIRDSMAKGAEAAKASTAHREADINGNGMYWYGKALEYKQTHEMAVQREKHLEGMLQDRMTERDYHLRMADKLAERIRKTETAWLVVHDLVEAAREDLRLKVENAPPELVQAINLALYAIRSRPTSIESVGDKRRSGSENSAPLAQSIEPPHSCNTQDGETCPVCGCMGNGEG